MRNGHAFRCPQLSVATPWSSGWGASSAQELAARAAERGIPALGLCDRNGLWNAMPFQRACQQHGVRPLFGARLRVEGAEARVLARDARGYAALCRLITRVQLAHAEPEAGGVGRSRRLESWLLEEDTASLAILGRERGLLSALARGRGPSGLYVAVPLLPGGREELLLAEELRLPPAAAPDVAFADPEHWERHRLLAAVDRNTSVERLDERVLAPRDAWLQGSERLARAYAHVPAALHNAAALAESCEFLIPTHEKRLPSYAGAPGGPAAELVRRCEEGRRRRGLDAGEERYSRQLLRELQLIGARGFTDYFLIVSDIVRWAQEQGIQTCGRGSVANSLVSYLLGITHVDPLRYDLYFERFLNAGRSDLPDVDMDFAWDERDRVLDFVRRRFGAPCVAMIGTHATYGARSAIREVAKVLGLPPREIGEVTSAIPWYFQGRLDPGELGAQPSCAHLPLDAEPWTGVLRQAAALQEFPRHMGIHAGGVIITPTPLTDYLPLQHAAKETGEGHVVITQWDMYGVEEAGLVKIDLLGNRGLAVIRDAASAVARNTARHVDFERLDPQRDERTGRLLERGDTMGCFYIESPSMRSLLQKLQCRSFPVLVAASSIIRPGIASSGMMQAYVERYHHAERTGRHDPSWYLHPDLVPLLGETFGVMAYQEDVMKVAEKIGGMSAGEADKLRVSMSRKHDAERVAAYAERFLEGARRRVRPEVAAELWRQIESFSGYSFCKAHSASYAEVSYRSAYLRAHHPAEFMAAVLSNYGGYYTTHAYLSEARRMGLRLRLPCVNRSGATFEGRGNEIRVGLGQVRGLSAAGRAAILRERAAHGIFTRLEELAQRARLQPEELEALVRAGACDALPDGLTRPERMRAVVFCARRRDDPAARPGSLFVAEGAAPRPAPPLRRSPAPEFGPEQRLRQEWNELGFLVSEHPLQMYQEQARSLGLLQARELGLHRGRRVRLLGLQVTSKPLRTRTQEPMLFLTFEDTTSLYEAVLFPSAYRRLAARLLTEGPYVVEGAVQEDYGVLTVNVTELQLLEPMAARLGAAEVRGTPLRPAPA